MNKTKKEVFTITPALSEQFDHCFRDLKSKGYIDSKVSLFEAYVHFLRKSEEKEIVDVISKRFQG